MTAITEMVCKNCGAPLSIENAEGGVIRCQYCKSVFAIAKKETDVETVALMRIAENELDNHDFDRAYTSYKKAADRAPDEPQAYFGMALAKNKVQYLQAIKDEKSGETYLQPICYEHSGKRFTEDDNYKRALELATQRQRAYYERQGEDIDYIAGEFERLEQSGLDFNCFVCVKVTDDSTKMRTSDCIDADEIYFDLRGRGYKPFFSERVVGERSGVNYEALILYALYKSECMVVVCHDEKYLETPWVKNEYTRFLRLMRGGEKDADAVTIAFKGNVIERLPGRSGKIQGIDLRRGDSFEKIAKFVEYHTPTAQAKRKAEEERKKKEAERVVHETEELKRKLEEQQREFEERDKKLREQLEQLAKDKAAQAQAKSVDMGGMSEEDMLAMVERAQKAREERERERKRREEEEERLAKEEAERKAREQREREEAERKRAEAERRAREEAERREREKRAAEEQACKEEEAAQKFAAKHYKISGEVLECYYGSNKIRYDAIGHRVGDGTFPIPSIVTKIGAGAFYCYDGYQEISKIKMLGNVTEIGRGAFEKCRELTHIDIPATIEKIGIDAFKDCNKLQTAAHDGAVYLGNRDNPYLVLKECRDKRLTSYKVHSGTRVISYGAFMNCGALTEIIFDDELVWIGESAFAGCSRLKAIKLPEGVKAIDELAFENCKALRELFLPSSLTEIAGSAFRGCKPETVEVADGNPKYKVEDGCIIDRHSGGIVIAFNPVRAMQGATDITNDTFAGSDITEIVIPEGVETIGESAFEGCEKLVSVKIPSTVYEIKKNAFKNCTSLRNIEIPDSVTFIGEGAFAGCKSLVSAVLPKGLDCIKANMFGGCEKLSSIVIPPKVEWIDSCAFSGCSSLSDIRIPYGVKSIMDSAFEGCASLQHILIPESVQVIGRACFAGCVGLGGFTIPNSVTAIGPRVFSGCENLQNLRVPFIGENIEKPDVLGYFFESKQCGSRDRFNINHTKVTYQIPKVLKSVTVNGGMIQSKFLSDASLYSGGGYGEIKSCDEKDEEKEASSCVEELFLDDNVEGIIPQAFIHAKGLRQVTLPKRLKGQIKDACTNCYQVWGMYGYKKVKVDERKHIKFIFT